MQHGNRSIAASLESDISRTPIEGGTLAAANTIKRIEHEQLPAAARAWSPIHTEPDFSVTALTPRTRVCGHIDITQQ